MHSFSSAECPDRDLLLSKIDFQHHLLVYRQSHCWYYLVKIVGIMRSRPDLAGNCNHFVVTYAAGAVSKRGDKTHR